MESALLEREEVGGGEVGAGAFGEDPDALLFVADLTDGAVKCGNGGFAVRAVNEDGATQSHCFSSVNTMPANKERRGREGEGGHTEPAKEGDIFERALRSDATVLGEESAKKEDIKLAIPHKRSAHALQPENKRKRKKKNTRLMVRYKDSRPRLQQPLVLNLKLNPNQRTRDILERPRGGPLRNAHFAHGAQGNARHDAVRGAREQQEVVRQNPRVEPALLEEAAQQRQGHDGARVEQQEVCEEVEHDAVAAVLQEPKVREVGEEPDEDGRRVGEEEVKHQLRER